MKIAITYLLSAALLCQGQELRQIDIRLLSGDGALLDIRSRADNTIEAEVLDEKRLPVVGAEVEFVLPSMGPSAKFPDGGTSAKLQTDERGRVKVTLRPNGLEGRFTIRITAVSEGRRTSTTASQVNTAAKVSDKGGKKWWLLAVAGAGAAAGTVFATRGGGGVTTPTAPVVPPTSVSIGAITVGAPR